MKAKEVKVYISGQNIKHNEKYGVELPVIFMDCEDETHHTNRLSILDKDGNEVASVTYYPDREHVTGVKVLLEADNVEFKKLKT